MSALPYIPLFVADYLADTSHLSTLEHGAYLLLIMNYWQRGQAIPCGDASLARIARVTEKEWQKIKPSIAPFFVESEGLWTHGRIEDELEKVRSKSATRAKAGQASAAAKAKRKANTSSTHVEQKPNYTDTDTDTETDTERESAHAQDPAHWQEVQGFLRDRTADLTDWEIDFLHSVKWSESLTKSQASTLKAIRDKLQSSAVAGKEVFVVRKGSPEFAAWINHKRGLGHRTAFLEAQAEITVPSLMPPEAKAA